MLLDRGRKLTPILVCKRTEPKISNIVRYVYTHLICRALIQVLGADNTDLALPEELDPVILVRHGRPTPIMRSVCGDRPPVASLQKAPARSKHEGLQVERHKGRRCGESIARSVTRAADASRRAAHDAESRALYMDYLQQGREDPSTVIIVEVPSV